MSTEEKLPMVAVPVWGGGVLVMPEPSWCEGHRTDMDSHPEDFEHCGPDIDFEIKTPHGPVVLLRVALSQSPLEEPLPHMAVQVGQDNDWFRTGPEGLREFAACLGATCATFVERLHKLAEEFQSLREEHAGDEAQRKTR